jgi:hypothetical protein
MLIIELLKTEKWRLEVIESATRTLLKIMFDWYVVV